MPILSKTKIQQEDFPMTRPAQHRLLTRMALSLQRAYENLRQVNFFQVQLPTTFWDQLNRRCQQVQLARSHHLPGATRQCERRLSEEIKHLIPALSVQAERLTRRLEQKPIPSLSLLYEELCSLFAEFEHVEFDLKYYQITVRTESISLEEIDLGSFDICLDLSELKTISDTGSGNSYRVVALEPNPAASSDETVHPHLQKERLCEGDGRQAIAQALIDGRLCDFFMLISNILQTYNSVSPYVALEDWYGIPCTDCGHRVHQEECYACECCDTTLCDSCTRNCQACCLVFCYGCENRCAGCEGSFCIDCLTFCDACQQMFCSECLEEGYCLSCTESELLSETELETEELNAQSQDTPQPETSTPSFPSKTTTQVTAAHAAIQSDSLGQTVVSA